MADDSARTGNDEGHQVTDLVSQSAGFWGSWGASHENRVENLTPNQQGEKLLMNVWSCAVESDTC